MFALLAPFASADGPDDRGKKGDRDKNREEGKEEEREDKDREEREKGAEEKREKEHEGQRGVARRAVGDRKDGCPGVALDALALEGETVLVTAAGLDRGAVLVRASGEDGTFDEVATLDAGGTFHQDTDVSEGTVYTYRLVVAGETCSQVEVTAIPVFPTPLGVGLALAAGLTGLVATGRGPGKRG